MNLRGIVILPPLVPPFPNNIFNPISPSADAAPVASATLEIPFIA